MLEAYSAQAASGPERNTLRITTMRCNFADHKSRQFSKSPHVGAGKICPRTTVTGSRRLHSENCWVRPLRKTMYPSQNCDGPSIRTKSETCGSNFEMLCLCLVPWRQLQSCSLALLIFTVISGYKAWRVSSIASLLPAHKQDQLGRRNNFELWLFNRNLPCSTS